MTEELIERVAKAIEESLPLSKGLKYDMHMDNDFHDAARAAIEASGLSQRVDELEGENKLLRERRLKARRKARARSRFARASLTKEGVVG